MSENLPLTLVDLTEEQCNVIQNALQKEQSSYGLEEEADFPVSFFFMYIRVFYFLAWKYKYDI